jgi:LDH2 family malate/lactate/ureidoglycolate dehydrogenase
LVREIHEAPTAAGVRRIMVPGEREWGCRQIAQVDGIALPEDVLAKLRLLADEVHIFPEWLKSQ